MEETMEETVSRKDQYTRWCTYCGNIFHRDEHLERHIRTRKCSFMPQLVVGPCVNPVSQ